jgi:hypothetical protein
MEMKVICIDDKTFDALVERVVQQMRKAYGLKEDKWISPAEAMHKLRIKSPTTLQKMRDEGVIRFSHPERRIILYDSESIDDYLDGYANKGK